MGRTYGYCFCLIKLLDSDMERSSEMCKVSIIMPSLNVGKYIEDCLNSVVNQTLADIEIICVDAGSTDETCEIISRFADCDKRIKLVHSDVKSYGYQMNMGIAKARGDYIGIVETDDYVEPDVFEKMYRYASANDVDFVKGGYKQFVEINGEKIVIVPLSIVNAPQYFNRKINLEEDKTARFIDPVHIWSGLYSREFLNKSGIKFNETPGASFQDTSFSLLVGVMAKSCMYVEEALYNYRIDNDNSSVKSDTKIDCVMNEYAYIDNFIKDKGLTDKGLIEEINKKKIDTYTWNYLRLSDKSSAIFFDMIQGEMSELSNDLHFMQQLIPEQQSKMRLLTDKSAIALYRKEENENNLKAKRIVEMLSDKNKRYVLISAGRIADKLLKISHYMRSNNICGICDNSKDRQGKHIYEFVVRSVEEFISQAKEDGNHYSYIIANLKHSTEICTQLCNLGVNKSDIIICDESPDMVAVFDAYKRSVNEADNIL